jgi:Heterokaryon incompatibility protein (HET)
MPSSLFPNMPTSLRAHLWKPLDPSKRQIRLLALEPNPDVEATPSGRLETKSLDRHPIFDAVSHAWGGPQKSFPIYIDNTRVPMTQSLHECLRHFRHATDVRWFWVDAISVNQFDVSERGQQVQQMEHIFRAAETVRVWLGDFRSERMNSVFTIINEIASGTKFSDVLLGGRSLKEQDAADLSFFTRSTWFNRLWVQQEVALARRLTFHYDDHHISLDKILKFYKDCYDTQEFGALTKAGSDDRRNLFRAREALSYLRVTSGMLSNSGYDAGSSAVRVTEFMCNTRPAGVHDIRDRVYGLTGIFSAFFDNDLMRVDYTLTPQEVYTKFTHNFINQTRSLQIFNQVNYDQNSLASLPTWVVDWSSAYHFLVERWRLVYLTDAFRASSNLAMSSVGNFDDMGYLPGDSNLLCLRGCIAARIASISTTSCECDPFEKGRFHLAAHEWLLIQKCLADWRDMAQAEAPELSHSSFARTCFRDVKRPSGDIKRRRCSRIATDDEAVKILAAVLKDLTAGSWTNEVYALFPAIARSVFFLTQDGRPGLGPLDTEPGDVVAIMAGGDVPYVLRESSVVGQGSRYRLVGECYVHGIMDGEAVGPNKYKDLDYIVLE